MSADLSTLIYAEMQLHETETPMPGFRFACSCGSFSRRYGFDMHVADQIAIAVSEAAPTRIPTHLRNDALYNLGQQHPLEHTS